MTNRNALTYLLTLQIGAADLPHAIPMVSVFKSLGLNYFPTRELSLLDEISPGFERGVDALRERAFPFELTPIHIPADVDICGQLLSYRDKKLEEYSEEAPGIDMFAPPPDQEQAHPLPPNVEVPAALPRCASPILPATASLPTTSAPTTSSANAPAPRTLSRSNLQRKRKCEAQILEHGYRMYPTALGAQVRPAVEVLDNRV
ncbi:hypothetical protein HYPSUDRAFT_209214 [Hypholoma sublateritium FD-334 SS-4]|uniref:Uncharacterized protein n=1 Tax=Hypholoma sublateritium (strain FD-334 SS-4) TaxID=945553 RepID=A0A0D2KGY7_HYPSF|nr:hypothetical protein HYPSUDRAFT_209214 [Hypholoma sublateritium FD-334 SS-4]